MFTPPRNMLYPALLPLIRTPRLPAVDWTDAPADLYGLVRFAERRNLVSARVPSLFKRSLAVVEWLQVLNSVCFVNGVLGLKLLHSTCMSVHSPSFSPFFNLKLHLTVSLSFSDICFFPPMPPHVLVDFMVFPPGHGRSVTDFWVWDAHGARLRCPDDVSGDIGGCSARRALKPKFYWPTQTMVTAGILPLRENSHGSTGNRTRVLMISRQRLWPLDHVAGLSYKCLCEEF